MALVPVEDHKLLAMLEGQPAQQRKLIPVSPEEAQMLEGAPSEPMAPRDLTPEEVFTGTRNPLSPQFWNADAAQTALGTMFTYSDDGVKNIWSTQLQDAGVEHEWLADEQGNDILRYKDRDGQWKQGYINASGVSGADALKPAAAIGAFGNISNLAAGGANALARVFPGAASKAVPAATQTMTRRAALTGAEAAASQGAVDEVAQQAGADVPVSERLTNAGVAFGFGALAEPVAKVIGKGATQLWKAVKGGPSAEKVKAAKNLVLSSVDDQTRSVLDSADDKFWRSITDYVDNIQTPEELRLFAVSQAYKQEIPGFQVFKPYVTQNLDDWTQFDEAVRSGYGKEIQRDMGQALKGNERAVAARIESLKPEATGGRAIADDVTTAGGVLKQGVSSRADDLWQQIDEAYSVAGSKQGGFVPQSGQYLDEKVYQGLDSAALLGRQGKLPPDATNAAAALDEVQDIVRAFVGQGDEAARPLTFREFEKTRQYLNKLRSNAKGADRAAVSNIIKSFDDWSDDMMDMALYYGDEGAMEAFKGARSLRAQYGEKFSPRDQVTRSGRRVQDRAGKIIEDVAELDLGPEQVINNVFGRGKLGQTKESVEVLRRLENIVGRDSTEWKALQEAGYMRLFYDRGMQPKSASNIVSEWKSLTDGDGKYWARRLFGDDEMKAMSRFVSLLERTIMPREAYNPSGPAIKRASEGLGMQLAKLGARLKMPLVSGWVDDAARSADARVMAEAGERAVGVPQVRYLPSANLSDVVGGSLYGSSAPVSDAIQAETERQMGRR